MITNEPLQPHLDPSPQIQNTAERFIWAMWLLAIFLVSVSGNMIILLASIKYNAFKLHTVIVTIIQHIAVCDLILSFVSILTQSVSLMADGWIFGTILCYVKVYCNFGVSTASRLLICGMTVSKLLMIKYPIQSKTWSAKNAHVTCAGLWVLSCCVPAVFLIVDKNDIRISDSQYTCDYRSSSTIWKMLRPIVTGIFVVIPTIIVVTTSIFLVKHLLYARKVSTQIRGKLRWQGIVTVLLTATVYCLCFLPKAIHMTIKFYVENEAYQVKSPRVTETLMYNNVVANFFVYSLSLPSFRQFLKSKMTRTRVVVSTPPTNTSMKSGNTQDSI